MPDWVHRFFGERRWHSMAPKCERREKVTRAEVDVRVHNALDEIEKTFGKEARIKAEIELN